MAYGNAEGFKQGSYRKVNATDALKDGEAFRRCRMWYPGSIDELKTI